MRTIAYYRVSTAAQGRSGLGLEAQREAVDGFCRGRECEQLGEYTEVESGKRNDRPQLQAALHHARITGATLVIAKLDRLSRNAAFLMQLQDSGAKFLAVDMPEACHLTVGILALVAQQEREAISARTKAALGAARARGTRLGNPNGAAAIRRAGRGNSAAVAAIKDAAQRHAEDLAPLIADLRTSGVVTTVALARELNERRIRTRRGGLWHASSLRNLLARL